jgi:hypothetical protein
VKACVLHVQAASARMTPKGALPADLSVGALSASEVPGAAERPSDLHHASAKLLCKVIADGLAAKPGIRPEDVLINLIEVKKENWSYGNGVAQYVIPPP